MSSVSLTIRTPTLNAGDDVTLSCHMDWSVLKVKQEIEKQFESHPRPEDQRLVYSGKLLDNNSVLEHVLRFDDEVTSYTVHLVCRQTSFTSPSSASEGVRRRATTASSSSTPTQQSAPAAASAPNYAAAAPQGYDMASWMAMVQQQMMSSEQNQEQAYWMQHMYAQYMTQYMQYMQAAASASYPQAAAATAATFIPPPPAPPAANLEAPQAQNNDNGAAAAAAVVPPQPQVMNAGAGGAMGAALEDEDNQQRDALDWLYIASRVLVLLSIVYFYSSLTRFLVVTVCGFFAYLWNIGAFRRDAAPPIINNNNDLQQQPQQQPLEDGEQQQQQQGDDDQEPQEVEGEVEQQQNDDLETENVGDVSNVVVGFRRADIMATAFTFVTTFFSSLLPEQPQVV